MDSFAGTSQDPASLHRYVYVANRPTDSLDPTGRFTVTLSTAVSIQGILAASAVVSAGMLVGTGIGAIDASLRDEDVLTEAIKGGLIGGLTAPLAGVYIARAVALGAGIGLSAVGALQAHLDGDDEAAVFRAALAAVGSLGVLASAGTTLGVRQINPAALRWTQTTAGGRGRAHVLRVSFRKSGWQGPPIDVVETPNGLVTVDHTRAAVALEQGIGSIPARVHQPTEALPVGYYDRFPGASTWGEAIAVRAASQRPPLPATGTPVPPRLPPQ